MSKEQLGNKKEILEIKNVIAKIKSVTQKLEEKEIYKVKQRETLQSWGKKSRETIFIIFVIQYDTY